MSATARLRAYASEIFPLEQRVPGALLLAASVATLLARLHGLAPRLLAPEVLLGAWAVLALMLTLRLMDELKDADTDRALFPSRPLPSGRVREADIGVALVVVASLFLAAHLGTGLALASAAVVLGYALLMFRWFFAPERIRPSLPLALATHTPVIPLMLLHLVTLFAVSRGLSLRELRWAPALLLVLMCWAGFLAWEIARKVRSPEEEDAYVTYSRLVGARGAVLLAAAAHTLSFACGLALFAAHGLAPGFLLGLVAGYAAALAGYLRFLGSPSARTSKLRPFAEAQLFGLFVGGVLS